jgi:pyruvate dehydrogenase E1 component alpha subunit
MDEGPRGRRTVARFEVAYTQFIDETGRAVTALPEFAREPEALIPLYRALVRTRSFDAKAVSLQRTGRLGTYASSLGQEAVAVGIGAAMRAEDALLPSFREHGAQLWRGATPVELLLYWGGDERGSAFAGPRQDFPISVPVATHAPHAIGVALAFKLRGEPRAAVCVLGDGATSKGDFYEAINVSGVMGLPAIYVVNNNRWAISVPLSAQTRSATLAQKAIAAGIPGEQVDGNDVVAMTEVMRHALERAYGGGGPTVIEALTYRLSDHTTVDDASRYRDDAEVSRYWEKEPVARLRKYLVNAGVWGKEDEEKLQADCAAEFDAATEAYLATPPMPAETMFDHCYATLPDDLVAQREACLRDLSAHG